MIEFLQIVKKERRETVEGGPPPVPSHGKHELEPDQQGERFKKLKTIFIFICCVPFGYLYLFFIRLHLFYPVDGSTWDLTWDLSVVSPLP